MLTSMHCVTVHGDDRARPRLVDEWHHQPGRGVAAEVGEGIGARPRSSGRGTPAAGSRARVAWVGRSLWHRHPLGRSANHGAQLVVARLPERDGAFPL